jgi:hypothetical protein
VTAPVPAAGARGLGEVTLTAHTRMVLLLFLQDTQRWWTAGGMTTPLGSSGDAVRTIHTRLLSARWATQRWEPTPGKGRRLVRLTPTGAEHAHRVLRGRLTDEDLVWAVSERLSVTVLHQTPPAHVVGEGGDPT